MATQPKAAYTESAAVGEDDDCDHKQKLHSGTVLFEEAWHQKLAPQSLQRFGRQCHANTIGWQHTHLASLI